MSESSTPQERDTVLRMACDIPNPDWLVLHLPDGRYAAFWTQGLQIEHASMVAEGDYSSCAYIGGTKKSVLAYIRQM